MEIGYKIFNNNEDFRKWQQEYPHRKVIQMQPMPLTVNADIPKDDDCKFVGDIAICLFITFFYNHDKKEIRPSEG